MALLFFKFTQFVSLENLSILNLALSGGERISITCTNLFEGLCGLVREKNLVVALS